MFNPDAKISTLSFGKTFCIIVDDALQDPDALREVAAKQHTRFRHATAHFYPGIQLGLVGAIEDALGEFFDRKVLGMVGGRRRLRMLCRLAMTTTPPARLAPMQCIPHRDQMNVPLGRIACASVLYLFEDPALGGTSFYRSRQDPDATNALVQDSCQMEMSAFTAKYGVGQGYPSGDSPYFERMASVPARYNRMIFYNSMVFHSGDIADARALDEDPLRGRLTLNGFFTCLGAQA